MKSRVWEDLDSEGCLSSPRLSLGISEEWEGGTRPVTSGTANASCLCQPSGMASEWQTSRKARNMSLQTGKAGDGFSWGDGGGISPSLCCHLSQPKFVYRLIASTQELAAASQILVFSYKG